MFDYSFVVPIYNDGEIAEAFTAAFLETFRKYTGHEQISLYIELIFVDDGSTNDSLDHLRRVANEHDIVRVISLSRNFGQHVAIACGYQHATGKVVGMMNVDMEDPPSEIPRLLDYLDHHDVDIVTATRTTRSPSWTSRVYHWVLGRLTGYHMPLNCATLRVMDRRFVDAFNELSERSLYVPALEKWLGFRHAYVAIAQQPSFKKRSSYTFRKRLHMAHDAIISFSALPLQIAAVVGFGIALVGFGLVGILVLGKLLLVEFKPGFTSTVSVITLLGGAQIMATGLAGLYIGRILTEVQARPRYVIRETINLGN